MNYGITLAAGQVRGVRVDLDAVAAEGSRYEPESAEAALELYAAALLPERDLEDTLNALRPLVGRPDIAREIRERSDTGAVPEYEPMTDDELLAAPDSATNRAGSAAPMTLSQIVGLIIGSPEFQRR